MVILKEREEQAKRILQGLPYKYAYVTGSFLNSEHYNDIDVFVISRTKKRIEFFDSKVKITYLDFNKCYNLFYHSTIQQCVSKGPLPTRPLKVTLSEYWRVINSAVPAIFNHRNFQKEIRSLILFTEYFKNNKILNTFELQKLSASFKTRRQAIEYIQKNVPRIFTKKLDLSYIKKFFYTEAGAYKGINYDSFNLLYELCHTIIKVKAYG